MVLLLHNLKKNVRLYLMTISNSEKCVDSDKILRYISSGSSLFALVPVYLFKKYEKVVDHYILCKCEAQQATYCNLCCVSLAICHLV